MIITREIINKNIKFHDIDFDGKIFSYDYEFLSNVIDGYKQHLLENKVKSQDSILILKKVSVWQTAAIFACFELGLKVVIHDYLNSGYLKLYPGSMPDPKTKALLPINYLLLFRQTNIDKEKYASKFCDKVIEIKKLNTDIKYNINENSKILCKENYIITKSVTSGTTSTPKCIEHTHEFLYELAYRNSSQFYGKFISFVNLNHGSSLFCYLIPALISKNVTDIYNQSHFYDFRIENKFSTLVKRTNDIVQPDHILLPYSNQIENWFKEIKDFDLWGFKKTNFHTLSYIKQKWVDEMYKPGRILDIISNFGSNETTGPIVLNKASHENFSEISYKKIDNYFKLSIFNKTLAVKLPVYNKIIKMNDHFNIINDQYVHLGRSDMVRINDYEIPVALYKEIVENIIGGELFYDQIQSEIYLSIWESGSGSVIEKITQINDKLKNFSDGKHYISKYAILDYNSFINGIKIDKEVVREYFRNPDGNYKTLN